MPTTKSRSRTMSSDSQKSRAGAVSPSLCNLNMECDEDGLSEAQKNFYATKKKAFTETKAKLEELAKSGAIMTNNPDGSFTFKITETFTNLGPVSHQPAPMAGGQPQYRFLVDKTTGRILGSLPGQGGVAAAAAAPPPVHPVPSPVRGQAPVARGRGGNVRMPSRGTTLVQRLSPGPQPTPGKSPQVVDLTRPGGDLNSPANIMKKTFPALSVTAKPQTSVSAAQLKAKRSELDGKVKGLLVHTPAKFTEWLIQQGLVRSEQFEDEISVKSGKTKIKLKLGMYSDGKKFPHSGGYVWIQEGQSNKYTSVFKGSIFESGSFSINRFNNQNQPPTVLLKLLYHWSCQTSITNVANWVKVDNKKIDEFFQLVRSVCVASIQDEVMQMSGPVEVGVISLGTTTADGQKREVRVEVLGVLDRTSKRIRLRATEPIAGATQGERFSKIFEPLPLWVQSNTKIITDYSVDKETLLRLGYKNVSQCSLSQAQSQSNQTNQQIMEYLKRVVPKMFQNTLSNLSTPVIQQFLDELTFRELFGTYPLACFDGIIQRISNQTSAYAASGITMLERLKEISEDPFQDWRFSEKSLAVGKKVVVLETQASSKQSGTKSPSPSSSKRASSADSDDSSAKKKRSKSEETEEPATEESQEPKSAEKKEKNKKSSPTKSLPQDAAFTAQNLENMAIYDAIEDECCECKGNMTAPGHYVAYLCCKKCRYSSCCSKAMSKHVQLFHSESKTFDVGKPTILEEPIYCCCGFSATSGNKMAKHLGTHGCKSAYPTLEEANKARVDSKGSATASNDDSGEVLEKNDTASENMDTEDEKETTEKDSKSNELSENENSEADTEKKDEATTDNEEKDDEENEENEKQPGPGGLLFGTFFNNREEDKEGDGEEKKVDEAEDKETEDKEATEKAPDDKKDDNETPTEEDDDKPPAQGGILFGTFFNNMEKPDQADGETSKDDQEKDTETKDPEAANMDTE